MTFITPVKKEYLNKNIVNEQRNIYNSEIKKLRNELKWKFEVIHGFFKQTEETTDDLKFNHATENIGRLKCWEDIITELKSLNEYCEENECYKLVLFARHGEGFHNVCMEKYGFPEWHRKYFAETTDGEIIWAPDPCLTPLGENQAKENHELWRKEIELGAPVPSKFYVSPLQRSINTCNITWNGIRNTPCRIVEPLRETIGVNLCDKRSSRSVIDERFKKLGFNSEGISEDDELFSDTRETLSEHALRVNRFLQELFEEDCVEGHVVRELARHHHFISTTSHAGTIRATLVALNHRYFTIPVGGMIPVVIKGIRAN